MTKPFQILREKMSPEAQARAAAKAERLTTSIPLSVAGLCLDGDHIFWIIGLGDPCPICGSAQWIPLTRWVPLLK